MSTLGPWIAKRRSALGLSQDELAQRMCALSGSATYTRNEISRYERGRRTPRGERLRWLAQSLECSMSDVRAATAPHPIDELTAVISGDASTEVEVSRLAYEWHATAPPQVAEMTTGRLIGEHLVEEVEGRTADLRRLDDIMAGPEMKAMVCRELTLTLDLVREARYSEVTGRRLLGAVSDLAQLAGWVASDAGATDEAARYYLVGVRAGHAAASPELAASALSSLAYQAATTGNGRDAVLMAGAAYRGTGTASPAARSLFAGRLAWAHARTHETETARRALDLADEHYAQAADEPAPPWAYWLTRDELAVMRGRVAVEVHRPDRAATLLSDAITRYPAERVREVTVYQTYLAEALVQLGDRTAAHQLAATLNTTTGSARADARLQRVACLLQTDTNR